MPNAAGEDVGSGRKIENEFPLKRLRVEIGTALLNHLAIRWVSGKDGMGYNQGFQLLFKKHWNY